MTLTAEQKDALVSALRALHIHFDAHVGQDWPPNVFEMQQVAVALERAIEALEDT